ncbi:hypothetical protein DV515_00010583 [Chloebia gouldiae]|uniref:Proline rich 18 n=1 Tax=Chloebia gouldiae TaxID=44316 RepID=A0A3L8S8X8_CHLGU|nr:hypothetical protein DV515_00010583 [Chloebia gouldiae]
MLDDFGRNLEPFCPWGVSPAILFFGSCWRGPGKGAGARSGAWPVPARPPRAGEGAGRGRGYREGESVAVGAELARVPGWRLGQLPRRAAGPCPPAGRSAALPGARSAPPWARSDEPEGTPGRPATLPLLLPAILPIPSASPAAARAQPKKPPAAASAPKKAAPRPAEEKVARKARGAPPERPGPLSSSWPCSSLQRPPPRRPPAERAARPQPQPTLPQPRDRPGAPGVGSRSCESFGEAAGGLSLSLPPEAIRVLQRRSLERQRGQPAPSPASRAAPARRGDLRALLKVSLLNDRHRYDDEEYEEEEAGAAADEGLVRKCTEWLRGVESAAGHAAALEHPLNRAGTGERHGGGCRSGRTGGKWDRHPRCRVPPGRRLQGPDSGAPGQEPIRGGQRSGAGLRPPVPGGWEGGHRLWAPAVPAGLPKVRMAGRSPWGEPVPFTRLPLGTAADNSAPGKTQGRGSGEAVEAGDRAGWAEPVAAGADGRRAGGEQCFWGEAGAARAGWGGAGARGVGRGCFGSLSRRTGEERMGLSDFIPSQAVIQIHPTFRGTANVRGGIGRKKGGREERKEGGSAEAASFVSVPWPLPSPLRAVAMPGALPSSVCWERRRGEQLPREKLVGRGVPCCSPGTENPTTLPGLSWGLSGGCSVF